MDIMELAGLCQDYVNGQSTAESPRLIAKAISGGQVELVKVVEALEIYLTSTNVDNRSLGTKLLSEVLTQVDTNCLNSDEVHYIVAFYCDRLKDKAIVIPHVLTGLHALVTQYSLSDADVVSVCRTIFKEVFNQSQQFPERRLVYAIMDHFLTNHLQAVQLMSSEFVLGYIQAIDGERDPRNLLTVFNSVYLIVLHLQFETLAEELFEVTSCYFPIDFTPPPNDPLAVTKDALVLSLRKCLTATEIFAEFCLPLLLDKLTSDLPAAKLDALCTLAAGACVYGVARLHPFLQPLWTTIKREMFQSPDEQIQTACVEALTAVTQALSQPLQLASSENHLNSFIAMVLKDCKRHLAEPELRLITPTVHLLRAIAVASDPACTYVVSSVLPSLLQQASIETKVSQQRVVLEALLIFITAMNQFTGGGVTTPLVTNKDALLKLLMSASTHQESAIRVVTMTTLGALLQTHEALERSEILQCSEHLKQVALSDQDASVREASCSAMALFASVDPVTVKDAILPSLLSLMADIKVIDHSVQPRVVDVLTAVCVVHPSLLELGGPFLVEQFGHLFKAPTPDIQLASSISSALVHITRTCIAWEMYQNLLSGGLLQQLVAVCVMSCDVISPVLENIAIILSLFTQAADESSCVDLLMWLVGVLVTGEVSVSEGSSPLPPLSLTTPPTQSQLIALLSAVLGAAIKSVTAQFSDALLPILRQLSCYYEHDLTCQHAAKCYASIVNKLPQGSGLLFLDEQLSKMWAELSGGECSFSTKQRILHLLVWVSKALLMQGHPSGMDTATKLLSLCVGSSELGTGAADGFQILMVDTEYMLNLKCHANVRLFYKQQLFMQVVPKVVELFKSHRSSEHRLDHLLRALSHLMQGVPKEVLLAELPTVIPLLLESMTSEDVGLKESTLNGLHSLITETPQSIIEHVPALVPRLLQLARDPVSMKVRIGSLSCIGSLTTLPTHIVYPYQKSIIEQLGRCLDDHKRLVRKEAVDTRSKWYLLGTLNEQ